MKSINLYLFLIFFTVFLNLRVFGQEKNTNEYPYGGLPDSTRLKEGSQKIPNNYFKVDFEGQKFINIADFWNAHFHDSTNFQNTDFESFVKFEEAKFWDTADFRGCSFKGEVNFYDVQFMKDINFSGSIFKNHLTFEYAKFNSRVDFQRTHFDDEVQFYGANFNTLANFEDVQFKGPVQWREAKIDSAIFSRSIIDNKFILGSRVGQRFDFRRLLFTSNAKLEIHELVEINMQPEKIKYLTLPSQLNYFVKKDIIEHLKNTSFLDDTKAKFELDYLFAKSTMYQIKELGRYPKWYQFWKLCWLELKWRFNALYYLTMGLGYKPHFLGLWLIGLIFAFTATYWKLFPNKINDYIKETFSQSDSTSIKPNRFGTLLNCIYFSSMVLVTFRLKGNILNFFDDSQKKIIVAEWSFGFLIYIAFLTLSKSGSILYTLNSLL